MVRRRRNHGLSVGAGRLAVDAIARIVPRDRLRVTRVQIDWATLVPEKMVEVAWPTTVRGDTLVVLVSDNQWLHELNYVRTDLLGRVQQRWPKLGIAEVRFRVGKLPPRVLPETPEPIPPAPKLSAEPDAPTLEALRAIGDEKLRMAAATARLALSSRR